MKKSIISQGTDYNNLARSVIEEFKTAGTFLQFMNDAIVSLNSGRVTFTENDGSHPSGIFETSLLMSEILGEWIKPDGEEVDRVAKGIKNLEKYGFGEEWRDTFTYMQAALLLQVAGLSPDRTWYDEVCGRCKVLFEIAFVMDEREIQEKGKEHQLQQSREAA